jgi:hypothetical protein
MVKNFHAKNLKPWSVSPSLVKHITFYQDPHPIDCGQHTMRERLVKHYFTLLNEHRRAATEDKGRKYYKNIARYLANTKAKELWALDEQIVIGILWFIFVLLEKMPNLLTFE